jgi:ribosomal RNA-processing protein 12
MFTAAGADRRRRPGQDAARFRTDADTGKLVLGGSDDSDADADAGGAPAGDDVAGGAYREKLTSADGFARGAGGRVKFHRDTKKRRRDAADAEDVEMDDAAPAPAPAAGAGAAPAAKKARARTEQRFGHEFKAKVRAARARRAWCGLMRARAESGRRRQEGRGRPVRVHAARAGGPKAAWEAEDRPLRQAMNAISFV